VVALTTGRWQWRTACAAVVVTYLLHPPVLGDNAGGNWDYIERQAEDPFDPPFAFPTSHEAKLMFRLVPALIVRAGIGFGGWMVLQALLGVVVFAAAGIVVQRHLHNRAASVAVVIAVGATYIGGQYAFDDHAYFDTLAVAGLVGAMTVRSYPAQFVCLLIALWTDERAVVATVAVMAYAAITRDRGRAIVTPLVLISYATGRAVLAGRYGLATPAGPNWIGAAIDGLDVSIPGLWMALKGLWVFPVLGAVTLISRHRYIAAAALLASVAASISAALAVLDTTRSAVYLLPAVFCGVAAIEHEREGLRGNAVRVALGASLALPTFFVIVPDFTWILPLPLQLLPDL